jgi:hypothetical protein
VTQVVGRRVREAVGRVELLTGRDRHHQRVAHDADDAVLDDRGDASATSIGRDEAVEEHVAADRVHREPERAVVGRAEHD